MYTIGKNVVPSIQAKSSVLGAVSDTDGEETLDTSLPLSPLVSRSSTASHTRATTIPNRVTKTKKSVSGVFDCCVCVCVRACMCVCVCVCVCVCG